MRREEYEDKATALMGEVITLQADTKDIVDALATWDADEIRLLLTLDRTYKVVCDAWVFRATEPAGPGRRRRPADPKEKHA